MTKTKKTDEQLRIEAAVNLAMIMFGKAEIDNARGDEKMKSDGKRHINQGFERIDKMFDKEESEK